MARWYYRGKTPTPISHPERGQVILTPRMEFDAPESAVAHLKSLVVRRPDPAPVVVSDPPRAPEVAPAIVSSPPVPPVVEVPKNRRSVQGEVEMGSDSAGTEGVLESEPTSTPVEEAAAEEVRDGDSAPAPKKQPKQPRERPSSR